MYEMLHILKVYAWFSDRNCFMIALYGRQNPEEGQKWGGYC
jgi:hypothetical protein